MNKIKIIQKGDKILTSAAKEIPMADIKGANIQAIIENLKRAIAENEEAVAVAAPQIGKPLRIFVVSEYVFSPENKEKKKNDYGYLVFINPKILKKSRLKNLEPVGK